MDCDPYQARAGIKVLHLLPFDPVGKREVITYTEDSDTENIGVGSSTDNGEGTAFTRTYRVAKGAPQIIVEMCHSVNPSASQKMMDDISALGTKGLRALGLCMCEVPEVVTKEMFTKSLFIVVCMTCTG